MMALLLALLLLPTEPPPEALRLFELGNGLYAEGDFRGAAAAYEQARETGWTSATLELNLGNAYTESGRLGRAVLHFERARRLDPTDEAGAHNLRLVRDRLGNDAPDARPPSEATERWLAATAGAWPLAALAFAGYLAVLALLGAWVWTRELTPWRRRALLVSTAFTALLAAAAVLAARYDATPRAVVVAESAALRTAPTPEAPRAGSAPEGAMLVVTDRRAGWTEVRLPDGTPGWAEAGAVEELWGEPPGNRNPTRRP